MLADIHLGRAIAEAKAENLTVELQDAYDLYSTSLFEQKKFEEAYKVRMDYETYFEESLADMSSEEMGAMSAKFQVEEYRKDMLAAELENSLQAEIVKNKNRLNIILMIVSICAVILFLVSLFAFRKRKKSDSVASRQKQRIFKGQETFRKIGPR